MRNQFNRYETNRTSLVAFKKWKKKQEQKNETKNNKNKRTSKQTNNICFKNALLSKARLLTAPANVERDKKKTIFRYIHKGTESIS